MAYTINSGAGNLGTVTLTGAGASGMSYSTTSAVTNGGYITSTGSWNGVGYTGVSPVITTNQSSTSITVKGDAEFEGDIKVEGKSLKDWMAVMEKRLSILVPDPKKLKKYEALQKAYNHYKMLEALCEADEDDK